MLRIHLSSAPSEVCHGAEKGKHMSAPHSILAPSRHWTSLSRSLPMSLYLGRETSSTLCVGGGKKKFHQMGSDGVWATHKPCTLNCLEILWKRHTSFARALRRFCFAISETIFMQISCSPRLRRNLRCRLLALFLLGVGIVSQSESPFTCGKSLGEQCGCRSVDFRYGHDALFLPVSLELWQECLFFFSCLILQIKS